MALTTIGDMRQHFFSVRHNSDLKGQLNTLVQEMTTGQINDLTAHLGNDQTRLFDIDRQINLARSFENSASETGGMLALMQTSINTVEELREMAAAPLVAVTTSTTLQQRGYASDEAGAAFSGMVQSLNARLADRALFAGNSVDTTPLADAETMLADIVAQASTASDAAGVVAALDTWFDDPGGGFETLGYVGSTGDAIQRQVGNTDKVEIGVRADDPVFRDVLKAAALGAIADDTSLAITQDERATLMRQAGEGLMSVASGLSSLQAEIGFAEARVEQASVRNAARLSAFQIARNELVAADPYETAISLEQVQMQLESHYTLTARLSQLSLTEYLR